MHHQLLRRQTKLRRLSLSKVNQRTRPLQTRSQVRRRFGIKSLLLEKHWGQRRRQQNQLNQRHRRKIPSNPRRSNQVSRPCAVKRKRPRRIEHPEASEAIALCLTKTITTENQFTRVNTTPESSAGRPMVDWLCGCRLAGSSPCRA